MCLIVISVCWGVPVCVYDKTWNRIVMLPGFYKGHTPIQGTIYHASLKFDNLGAVFCFDMNGK